MPTYEYACTACANQWEEIQKISEAPLDTCPKCGEKTAKRQISGGNFILKGGGWYADLYSSSSNKKSGGEKSSGEGSAAKSESTTSPKTETKTPAAAATPSSSSSSSGSSGSGSSTPSKT
jgi:putative FmdB family regulatory protein